MVEQALEKLRSEIEKSKNAPHIQVVGAFLTQHLTQHPQDAEKILAANKTIAKSIDEMRKVAEKKKVGNMAVLTDQEGFEIVLGYFGINNREPSPIANSAPAAEEPIKQSASFDVRLEDLLL